MSYIKGKNIPNERITEVNKTKRNLFVADFDRERGDGHEPL
jgi:hypothetical protein